MSDVPLLVKHETNFDMTLFVNSKNKLNVSKTRMMLNSYALKELRRKNITCIHQNIYEPSLSSRYL
ncbi:CLUMA_CG006950, isoform A [Clunio marinus]|uniref:CLUMA_CG006950, isoform A n=1 Tax=Clunio marinus TaxID=568069 RepID=A0A1J1I3H4_9DIPT|nr:CLUMA_CG006950, isoform A [Clunio marinus]